MSSSIKFSLVPSESNNSVMFCFNLESAKLKNSMGYQEYKISLNMLLKKKPTQAGIRAKHSAKCRVLRRQPNTNRNIKGWSTVDRWGQMFLAKTFVREKHTAWERPLLKTLDIAFRMSEVHQTFIFRFVNTALRNVT